MFASGCISGNVEVIVGVWTYSSVPLLHFCTLCRAAGLLLRCSQTSPVAQGLDEGLGLAFVHLDVDLGIFVLLVPDALEAAAVAEQVEGQAESHHAQRQQTHVHLKGAPGSVWHRYTFKNTSHLHPYLTHRGSPFRGPTMAMKRGCWSRANRALIRDCIPVRLPNWDEGYLRERDKLCPSRCSIINDAIILLLDSTLHKAENWNKWTESRCRCAISHLHSSIEASHSRVDESSDDSVQNKGKNLKKQHYKILQLSQ